MGLFSYIMNSIEDKNAAKDELSQKMAESQLIDLIVNEILAMDRNSFVYIQQSPQDNRKRRVVISNDCLEIKWSTFHWEKYTDENGVHNKKVEDIILDESYSFSKSGYQPLDNFTASNGTAVSSDKVVEIFAETIRKKMEQAIPECKFDYSVSRVLSSYQEQFSAGYYYYEFYYEVPEQQYKSAF